MRLLAFFTLAISMALQGPGPWMSDSTENALRRVHKGALDGRTTLWLRVRPQAEQADPRPTTFLFYTEFAGKQPRRRPPVTLLVASDVRFFPLTPRVERIEIAIDGEVLDLLAPGEPTTITYSFGDAPARLPTGATIALSPERLDRLAGARSITGNALGVPFTFDRAQRAALADFRLAVQPTRP